MHKIAGYNSNGESHRSCVQQQEQQAPTDGSENGLRPPTTLPSPNLQASTAAGPPLYSTPFTLTAAAAVGTDSIPISDAAQNTSSPAPLPSLLPGAAPLNMPPPPPYHHTAGSSTICYLPQPPIPPSTTPHPDPSPENNHTQLTMALPTNPTTAMYFFPPPPPKPHDPAVSSFSQPLIPPPLTHPYPPMAIPSLCPPHQPRSPPIFLPPLSGTTTGTSSASSTSPSPNHTAMASPQITSHCSEDSAQNHSPDQDNLTGMYSHNGSHTRTSFSSVSSV